jgi:hypothetical protein
MKTTFLKVAMLATTFSITLAWVGCGGGGDDGGDGSSTNTAPRGTSPASLEGKQFTVQEAGGPGPQDWRFANGTWDEFTAGVKTRTGQYTYNGGGADATLILTDLSTTNETISVTLNFTNNTSGGYTFTTTPTHRSGGGFFYGLTDTAPDGTVNNPGTPTTGSPTNNFAPTTLANRTMLGTRTQTSTGTAGQTHTYTFGVTEFRDQDPPEEGIGVYTYTPQGDQATLILNYTASSPGGRTLAGDQHTLDMRFTSTNQGTFTSTYRSSNDVISINGTFVLP